MAYNAKTNWVQNDTVEPKDMNRIEQGIADLDNGKLDKTATATKATQLATSRTISVSGGVTGTAQSFDGTANVNIPVTAVNPDVFSKAVPLAKGGTGATTAADALINLGLTATAAELNYCDGVTSNIQTQLNNKAPASHTQAASTITGLAPVATSGSYNDLANKPSIPAAVTVDTTLNASSTNAIQNGAVTTALSGKAPSSHNHSTNDITSGTLPIARGGTGATTAAGIRNTLGLGNTTGALPVANGGTGVTTAVSAANAFINALATESTTPVDGDYVVTQVAGGSTTDTTYRRKPLSVLWTYIQNKINTVLGLTATSFKGSAATLTTSRTIALSGGVTGTATSFDGSANITIPVTSINVNNLSTAVPITKGGTGATTITTANANLTAFGVSDNAPATDLPADYPRGIKIYMETGASKLPYKPSEFGIILSIKDLEEVTQFYFVQPYGQIYRRGGNIVGWNAQAGMPQNRGWVPVMQGANTVATAQVTN